MEDKIIGPLTMAQFLYVMFGGMTVYILFISFAESAPILFWLVAPPIGLFTLALAFMKVQDQPFPKFLAATLLYLVKPKARVWAKDPSSLHLNVVSKTPSTPEEKSPPQTLIQKDQLGDLVGVLDTKVSNNELRMTNQGDQPSKLGGS